MQDLRKFTPEQIIARAKLYERKMRWLQADARQFIAGERNDEKEILSRYHALRKQNIWNPTKERYTTYQKSMTLIKMEWMTAEGMAFRM